MQEYSARLDYDVEWAMDRKAADDWHSRLDSTWVIAAIGRGMYDSFDISIPGTSIRLNPMDSFASANGGTGGNPPVLPPAMIIKENGVRMIHHYQGGKDHAPAHIHVQSDGQRETRVKLNGLPVDRTDRPLTVTEPCKYSRHIPGAIVKPWQTLLHEQIQSTDGRQAA